MNTKKPIPIKELLPELSDEDIFNELRDNIIYEELHDERRWYQIWLKISKIKDHLFQFFDYHCTGDISPSDMDLKDDIQDVWEVETYEKVITAYRKIEAC